MIVVKCGHTQHQVGDPGIGLLLLCHPQNPTGLVFTEDQLVRIVELSDEHTLLIVSDEIHSDLVHPGSTHIPMLTIPGASSRTVTVTSGVKTFALGGLRCAVAVCGNERLHAGFSSVPAELRGGPNRMGCEATIAAWDTGSAWTDGLLALLDSHRHHLHERLAAELPEVFDSQVWVLDATGVEDPVSIGRGTIASWSPH